MLAHLAIALAVAFGLGGVGSGCDGCSCSCECCRRREPAPPPTPRSPPPPPAPTAGCGYSCANYGDRSSDGGPRIDVGFREEDAGPRRDALVPLSDVPGIDRCDYSEPGSGTGALCSTTCARPGLVCAPIAELELDGVGATDWGDPRCVAACDESTPCTCGACLRDVPLGPSRLEVAPLADGVCAPSCTPSLRDRGDCLGGATCDARTRACVPACATDGDCRVLRLGPRRFAVDDRPELTCDLATGRCRHVAPAGARVGDACTSDLECPDGAECWVPDTWSGPPGICTRFSCDVASLACGADACSAGEGAAAPFCLPVCATTDECPVGLSCDAGLGVCWRLCAADAECRPGEACESDGRCRRAPAADAGTPGDADVVDGGDLDTGDLDASDLDAGDLDANDLDAGDLDAGDLDAGDLDSGDLDSGDLDTGNLDSGDLDAGEAVDAGL